MKYISVYNARDQFEASRIIDLLKVNSIESYCREAAIIKALYRRNLAVIFSLI